MAPLPTKTQEADAGTPVKEICRKKGISDATYYNWQPKYSGMQTSDLKRMKEMEQELYQFKRMYADMARPYPVNHLPRALKNVSLLTG